MRRDLDPSPAQARQWVQEELARDEYHDGTSVVSRVLRWLAEQLDAVRSAPADSAVPSLPPAVSAVLLTVLVAALALLATRVRANRRAAERHDAILGGLALSAADLRRHGEAALRDGRWDDAVVHFTRAIARDGVDRTLLSGAPSLTAHEVGTRLGEVFPALAAAVLRCTDVFDAVRYGGYAATSEDAHDVRATCEALRDARPVLVSDNPADQREPAPLPAAFRSPQ